MRRLREKRKRSGLLPLGAVGEMGEVYACGEKTGRKRESEAGQFADGSGRREYSGEERSVLRATMRQTCKRKR